MQERRMRIAHLDDTEKVWIHEGGEFSQRVVTTTKHGAQNLSFHVTTFAPNFSLEANGDGEHELVMYCMTGSATVTPDGEPAQEMSPGVALYLPPVFHYDLVVGEAGMTVAVAYTPPRE